jgi:diguanylate cyclase (GGDEF)-like protein
MPDQALARHRLIAQLYAAVLAVGVLDMALIGLLLWPGAIPVPLRPPLRLLDAALTLVLIAAMLFVLRRLRVALQAGDAASLRQQQLFDAMPTGLALWDADERLVVCNADFRRLYAPMAAFLQPGVKFEAAMRRAVELGLVPDAAGREQAWLAERLAMHRHPGPPILRQTSDGRWRRILEQRLPDGSVLGHSIDVTELVAKEQALDAARHDAERARQRLYDAIEALPATFELYDADDRLVMHNRALRDAYPQMAEVLDGKPHFEELARRNVATGGQPQAAGDPGAWVALRQAQRRAPHPGSSVLLPTADGRWLRLFETRLSDGGLVAIRVDVTELERTRAAAALATARLEDAIAALPAGFELYDADDRLVMVNDVNIAMYPLLADLARRDPPPTFEEVVRTHHARGGLPQLADAAALQAWLDQRQAERSSPAGGAPTPRELQTADGRWVRSHERRTRDGGVVGIRIDITELMQRDQALRQLNAELDRANAELRQLSDTDPLTGLANRRLFDRRLADECARAARHGLPLALVVIDIDHFKRYNDRHGHPQGDQCLRQVATLLRDSARRPADLAARLGGEEFALLLPHDSAADAAATAERLRHALVCAALAHGDSPVSSLVTVSIGIAACAIGTACSGKDLLAAADAALYRAKQAGRDQAQVAAADPG